jgi:hypothetical protein
MSNLNMYQGDVDRLGTDFRVIAGGPNLDVLMNALYYHGTHKMIAAGHAIEI